MSNPGLEDPTRVRPVGLIGWAPWVLAGVATVLAIAVAVLMPGQELFAAQVLVLMLGVAAAWAALRVSRDATRSTASEFDRVLTMTRAGQPYLGELRSIEVALALAVTPVRGSHAWLAPILRDIARLRLGVNRNIDLDAWPDEAERALGDPLWRLIQSPDDLTARGGQTFSIPELESAVGDLERI
jgi:hypothetical protein